MARKFNGTSDTATLSPAIAGMSIITLAFWLFMTTNPTAERVIVCSASPIGATGKNCFDFEPKDSSAGNGSLSMTKDTSFWVDTYVQPTANVWHHYVAIYDRTGPTHTLYIDGSPVTLTTRVHQSSGYGNFTSNPWFLFNYPASSWFQPGTMAELALWSAALTAKEAAALAAGASPVLVHPDSLVLYSPMLGDSPEPDYSGNRKSSTLTGTTAVAHPRVSPPLRMPRSFFSG